MNRNGISNQGKVVDEENTMDYSINKPSLNITTDLICKTQIIDNSLKCFDCGKLLNGSIDKIFVKTRIIDIKNNQFSFFCIKCKEKGTNVTENFSELKEIYQESESALKKFLQSESNAENAINNFINKFFNSMEEFLKKKKEEIHELVKEKIPIDLNKLNDTVLYKQLKDDLIIFEPSENKTLNIKQTNDTLNKIFNFNYEKEIFEKIMTKWNSLIEETTVSNKNEMSKIFEKCFEELFIKGNIYLKTFLTDKEEKLKELIRIQKQKDSFLNTPMQSESQSLPNKKNFESINSSYNNNNSHSNHNGNKYNYNYNNRNSKNFGKNSYYPHNNYNDNNYMSFDPNSKSNISEKLSFIMIFNIPNKLDTIEATNILLDTFPGSSKILFEKDFNTSNQLVGKIFISNELIEDVFNSLPTKLNFIVKDLILVMQKKNSYNYKQNRSFLYSICEISKLDNTNKLKIITNNNNNDNVFNQDETLDLNINHENLNSDEFHDFSEPFDNFVSKELIRSISERESLYKIKK